MSKLNAAPQAKPNSSRPSLKQQQQQSKERDKSFFKKLITQANEHSKKLTIVDTVIYCVLMVALIALIIIKPSTAEYCVDAMLYVTTAHVSLRLGYSIKGIFENTQKIKNSVTSIKTDYNYYYEEEATEEENSEG